MWRSLFLALGIFSIILGLETMVIEQASTTNVRRFPKFLSSKSGDVRIQNAANPVFDGPLAGNRKLFQTPSFNSPAYSSSNAGSNQYAGSQSSIFNRVFGGLNRKPASRPGFGFAGFNNKAGDPGYNGTTASPVKSPIITAAVPARTQAKRVIYTKDWMPWSLMAAGTIIVLYTYTLPRRRTEPGPE